MREQDLVALKQLAEEASQSMPANLMMDGKGFVYCNGHPVSLADLLCDIDRAVTKVNALYSVINNMKTRAKPKKKAAAKNRDDNTED